MGNPTKEAIEFNKPKSQRYLKAIAIIGALLVTFFLLVLVVGMATIFKMDGYKLSAYCFYIGIAYYTFKGIRKDQRS